MKQIAVVSGKGGTGKTTITASFAALAKDIVIADCDVDAADLHLLLNPTLVSKEEFKGPKIAAIDRAKCNECGRCEEVCRFNAVKNFSVDPILCEGCGVCLQVCPVDAISFEENVAGYSMISKTRFGPLSHATMNPAEENSGKLVTLVRNNATQIAEREGKNLILIDGPPGIGCPVIASLTGVDLAVIVTEPTMSGIHDLERILSVAEHFGIRPLVCINMYDINNENTGRIVEFCQKSGIEVGGRIPFNPAVTEAMVAGKTVIEYDPNNPFSKEVRGMWNIILTSVMEASD
jgi:MinD superfamily P-loop ATPase